MEFPVARLDGSDDDEDGIQNPKDHEEDKSDQDQTEERGHNIVDQHGDLEVDRFLAVGIELRRIAAFGQPDDEWRKQVSGEMEKYAEQRAGVTKGSPSADVGRGGDDDRQWRW